MNCQKTESTDPPTLSTFLAEPLRFGDPDVAGNLAVFPVFGPAARLEYLGYSQGRAGGATVVELEGGASVNDLTVHNPTDKPSSCSRARRSSAPSRIGSSTSRCSSRPARR